ncbi:MAG: aspartyl protease family protein [Gemmatimonadaceae bacterium]
MCTARFTRLAAHRRMRRPSPPFLIVAFIGLAACRSSGGVALPAADAIVEGRVAASVVTDTIEDDATVRIDKGRWTLRSQNTPMGDFWADIAMLDLVSAEKAARSFDERTFAVALKKLMASNPEDAAIAFQALHLNATDPTVRSRARIGLTMALSWQSDWPALAGIGADPDSSDLADSSAVQAGVERWGRALSLVPVPRIEVPIDPVTLPLRRSAFGTPVVTVSINGHPHEFWLDTGASMTLLSDEVAVASGVRLAARDTLALGVVAGHIPARAVFIDSLSLGPMTARGLGAALVNKGALRMDHKVVNGMRQSVQIDGVIGTDLLRHLDLVIDANASTITIKRPRRDPRAVRNLFWVGYPVVRLVTKDGRPALFGLDTGAEGTYITTSLLRKQPKTPVAMRRGSIGGLGAEQHATQWVARQLALSDGDYAIELKNVPVAPERRWTFVNFDGVLGSDIALASRMHLDFVNGVFDVRKPTSGNGITVTVGH